jgi:aryl sulfotransferase
MLIRPAIHEYRTWVMDSRRWKDFRPRNGDVIVATYPKSGTTWMQQIVSLLIFQTPEARPLDRLSPWIDMRISKPIEEVLASIDAQTHRRAMKTHLPLDGLPLYDNVRYIHVARDGRDACMSFHNHATGFKEQILTNLDAAGVSDETIARLYPRLPADPAEYFGKWLRIGAIAGQTDGYQSVSYFEFEKSYWAERHRPNVLFVHYGDLKVDLEGEMRRIAAFLDITVPEMIWPSLVHAAGFQFMKQQGASLMPGVTSMFSGGKDRFFNKGQNGRWKVVFRNEDLAMYDAKLVATLPPTCITWLEGGKRVTGDPRYVPG